MKTSINFEINSIESISRQTDWFINYRIDMKFSLLIFLTSFFLDTLAVVGDSQAHSTGRSSFRAAPWRHSRVKISNRFDFNSIRVGWRFRRFFQDWSARSTGRSSSGAVSVQPRDLNRWEKTGGKRPVRNHPIQINFEPPVHNSDPHRSPPSGLRKNIILPVSR